MIEKARAFPLSLFCFPLILLLPVRALSFPDSPGKVSITTRSAYTDVLNLDFAGARKKLSSYNISAEKDPFKVYTLNLADALEVFTTDDEDLYESLAEFEEQRLEQIEQLPDDLPEKLFLEAEVRIHWAFVKLRFGSYLKAFLAFRKAYYAASENLARFPGHIPTQKSLGVLHTIMGAFPENYNWILSLAGMEGNIQKGMEQLALVSNSNSFLSLETKAYVSIFQTFLLNRNNEAVENLRSISGRENYVAVELLYALTLIKNSESKKAQTILMRLLERGHGKRIPLLYYVIGETYLQETRYSESIRCYTKFVSTYQGQNYVKDAYVKLAINYWLLGDNAYQSFLSKAVTAGQTIIDADKNASQLIRSQQLPNKTLLKIRYTTDGGFYELAEKFLLETSASDLKNKNDLLEFHYRKARFYHKTENIDSAITEYKTVISLQESSDLYFAPNSSLQLGYIFSSQEKYREALVYFENAKKYKNHPYKYSIDKKATIEIDRILGENF